MQTKNKGWSVTMAGLAINLALGILYTWSVLKESILQSINNGGPGDFNWEFSSLNDPYAVCVLVFAFSMVLAGKIQDVKGPSFTAKIGGVLVGAGFIIASLSTNYYGWVIGFGILGGVGIGFGYSSATPAALKWFGPAKTGLIAGLVVSGFGLAPVYIAPLSSYLVGIYGLQTTMLIYGIAFIIIVGGVAFFLKNPPEGYVPQDNSANTKVKKKRKEDSGKEMSPWQMLRTSKFYLMWIIYFMGAGAGLMVIGNISGMAKASMGEAAFVAVVVMAVGNASGRIIAGVVSDKISKATTLFLILLFQGLLMFLSYVILNDAASAITIVLLATLIGFNYGTNLTLFPAFTKGFWGMKNFGVNYGIMMTAWGMGGFVFSKLSQVLFASSGDHVMSFIIAGTCLGVCLFLTIILLDTKGMTKGKKEE